LPSSSFSIQTFDESGFGIEKLSSGLTVTASAGVITDIQINPTDKKGILEYATTYYVKMKVQNSVSTSSSIIIYFPSTLPVSDSTCSVNGLNGGYSCVA